MKKFFLSIVGATFLVAPLSAQLYVRASVGYGVPTAKEAFASNNFVQVTNAFTKDVRKISDELIPASLGGGLQVGLLLGYDLNEHVSFELGAQYLNGSAVKARGEITLQYSSLDTGHVTVDISRKTQQMRVLPSVVIRGGGERFVPYARFGLVAPVGGKSTTNIDQFFTQPAAFAALYSSDSLVHRTLETRGTPTIGFTGALGMTIKVAQHLRVFIEIATQSLSIRPKSTTIVEFTGKGRDLLPLQKPYQIETTYLTSINSQNNNIDYNPGAFIDPNTSNPDFYDAPGYQKPKEELAPLVQFSNVGFNFGLKFSLK